MVDTIGTRGKKTGEVGNDSVVRVELQPFPVEARVFADCVRDQEIPTDIVAVWDDVVGLAGILFFRNSKEECPRSGLGKYSEMVSAGGTLQACTDTGDAKRLP